MTTKSATLQSIFLGPISLDLDLLLETQPAIWTLNNNSGLFRAVVVQHLVTLPFYSNISISYQKFQPLLLHSTCWLNHQLAVRSVSTVQKSLVLCNITYTNGKGWKFNYDTLQKTKWNLVLLYALGRFFSRSRFLKTVYKSWSKYF